jgi:OOP family OmpA-OmpF porin
MEDPAVRVMFAPFVALPLVIAGLPVLAQSSPSADQIITSLKPSGNLISGGTRGIRLSGAPAPAPTPVTHAVAGQTHPTAHAAAAQLTTPAAPSANLTVNFASGSSDLTPQAIQALNELGRALSSKDLAAYKFRIEGHTDTVGTPEANRALSEQRAKAVVAFITSHFGVDEGRLQAVGMGEQELAVPTPAQTPEPRNRRVLVVNLGA